MCWHLTQRNSQLLNIGVIDVETCQPLPNVLVDIWQANATGFYAGMSSFSVSSILSTNFILQGILALAQSRSHKSEEHARGHSHVPCPRRPFYAERGRLTVMELPNLPVRRHYVSDVFR